MTCLPGMLALFGRGLRRIAHEVGQAGEIGLAVQRHRVGLLVGQHVLAERGAERREPLDDRRQAACFLSGVERRALAAVAGVVALQHALLLGREAEAVALVDRARRGGRTAPRSSGPWPSARRCAARCRARSPAARRSSRCRPGARTRRRRAARRGRHSPARRWCCRSVGGSALRRDLGDLGVVLGEGPLVGRKEMLGLDAPVGRDAERRVPGFKERIFGGNGRWPGIQGHARILPSSRFQNVN